MELPSKTILEKVISELGQLNEETVQVGDRLLKAGQCYRYEMSPPYVLFNTNCPDSLKQKINDILSKYLYTNETGA